ncbi:MAG: hypothetical protein RLZZ118_117 [Bacteroidota bacterium]|jgi:hypothetical protein
MKKIILAIIAIASIAVACNKAQTPVENSSTTIIKKTRAASQKCNRDLIVHVNGNKSYTTCPLPGNCCYKDKKGGKHHCDCEIANKPLNVILTDYTNSDGTVNTISYFQTENYVELFPDVDATIYAQIMNGNLKLYKLPWDDQTPADAGDLPLELTCQHTFVLSTASTISQVNNTNIQLIWVY